MRCPFLFYYNTSLFQCKGFQNLVLIEHECMGPNLTPAEGMVLGVGAKIFQIAGPVIVYCVSASVLYGFIYWLWITLF